MNFEQARFNMVEQQVRPWQVLDNRVLDLLASVPREIFVPEKFRNLAFADTRIPLEHGQCMMPPREEGRMLQALAVGADDKVLEIGTGTGYTTALLAHLADKVYSVDIFPEFIERAGQLLSAQGLDNIELEVADAASGWQHQAPYDAIAVTGSLFRIPEPMYKHLRVGGRLFCIIGEAPAMTAVLVTRIGENDWREETLFETQLPALLNAARPSEFRF